MRVCENRAGCTPDGGLYLYPNGDNPGSYCGACKVVSYCSKRCQREDWPRHKRECAALKAQADAHRVPAEQVLGEAASAAAAASASTSSSVSSGGEARPKLRRAQCGLCGGRKPPFEITECCNRVVCCDRDDYVLMSYGRNSCARNHDRYTVCAAHYNEGHAGRWQDCQQCKRAYTPYDFWRFACNHPDQPENCNFPDAVPADLPRPPLPKCETCGRGVDTAMEEHSTAPHGLCCSDCFRY